MTLPSVNSKAVPAPKLAPLFRAVQVWAAIGSAEETLRIHTHTQTLMRNIDPPFCLADLVLGPGTTDHVSTGSETAQWSGEVNCMWKHYRSPEILPPRR